MGEDPISGQRDVISNGCLDHSIAALRAVLPAPIRLATAPVNVAEHRDIESCKCGFDQIGNRGSFGVIDGRSRLPHRPPLSYRSTLAAL
jgi:hypothetical protein